MTDTHLKAVDWARVAGELNERGWAVLPGLLPAEECEAIAALYGDSPAFRSQVSMARHGFGKGEYRYFAYPLPDLVHDLRAALYPRLQPVADRWYERMNADVRFPDRH